VSLSPELDALLVPLLEGHANRQRRKGIRRPVAIGAALLAAAALGAAALAATSSWIFRGEQGGSIGTTTVDLHGITYTLRTYVDGDGRSFFIGLTDGEKPLVVSAGTSVIHAPGVPDEPMLPDPPPPSGQAVYGNSFKANGGEIWFGIARPEVTRVAVTDQRGRVFSTDTVRPPRKFLSVFRFWVVALPASHATSFTAYDNDGNVVQRRPLYATTNMFLY
jgi:hypothetical protein